ncbi:hypothetical protein FN846DRAFT_780975 [Sphaerosporella brunnea]|uniref:Uncharacterized protein n=1 Tax=Sphaerosporella brunnea TaxID=1250544 RepID=A0A5J5ET43_9PEZI|nr:hypothetical protein FN846DRAFT_780975 [Sphaerosporella brunnea]
MPDTPTPLPIPSSFSEPLETRTVGTTGKSSEPLETGPSSLPGTGTPPSSSLLPTLPIIPTHAPTDTVANVPAVPTVVPSISLTSKIGSIVSDVTSAVPSVPLTSDHSSATGIISGLPLPTNVTSVIASITSGVPITTGIISSEVASITSGPILSNPTTTPEPSTTLEITTKPTEITTSTTRPPIISASSGVAPTSIWFQTSTLVIAPPLATVTATSTASNLIATGTSTSGSVVAIPTALDPQLPKVITPAGGMPEAPADMVLVRLGFLHALNYQWVVSHSVSIAQIFQFLPQGLNYGLGVDSVTMHSLQPYDTRLTKGYITTLALAFIPSQLFDELDLQRRTPGSKLLNNPESSVHTLMGLLDPTIPLRASADEASGNANGQLAGGGSSWSDGTSNESNGSGSGSPIDNKSGSISTKTVGIGAGVVMGAFAYGGAMFFVARRYRQRRSRHSRTASIPGAMPPGGPAMAENSMTGAAMMQGARVTYGTYGTADRASKGSGGKVSARGPISGPVMAVNSLGWS